MDIAQALRELSRLRLWVVAAACVSVLAGALTVFDVSLTPPSATEKAVVTASASTELLVDTARSSLGGGLDPLDPLVQRTAVYAKLMKSGPIVAKLSRAVGGAPVVVETDVPVQGAPADETAGARSSTLVEEERINRLTVVATPTSPVIALYAQAPTPRAAAALANEAAQALPEYLRQIQRDDNVPAGTRVTIEQLNRAVGYPVNSNASYIVAALIAGALFVVLCLLILFVSSVVTDLRRAKAIEASQAITSQLLTEDRTNGLAAGNDRLGIEHPSSAELPQVGEAQ
jgi:hypothetical protein